jgi:exodeoxyribonuclease VII large subunit
MIEERKIYSLTQLNISLENHFKKNFSNRTFWITAEISKLNEKNGHYYLDLVDTIDGKTTSQINANIWARNIAVLREKIGKELFLILKVGNKALLEVVIDYHKIYGLKLNIVDIDLTFSHGEVEKNKKETIKKLKDEGIFDNQRKLRIPRIIKRIGLITSIGTDAYKDFTKELLHNNIFRNFKLKEFGTSVQGDRAKNEILEALNQARTFNLEAIVIIRGGGSPLDLNIFNDYDICKVICDTRIPIFTGIGHEPDEVVADLVASISFKTPTAVAKYFYIEVGTFKAEIGTLFDTICKKSQYELATAKNQFNNDFKIFIYTSQNIIKEYREILQNLGFRGQSGFIEIIQNERKFLHLILDKTTTNAINYVIVTRDVELVNYLDMIKLHIKNNIDQKNIELNNLMEVFKLLNPMRLLESGYTITTFNEIDLKEIDYSIIGKEIKTLSKDYLFISQVIKQIKN